jgi:inhibitor of cysteine peptidase
MTWRRSAWHAMVVVLGVSALLPLGLHAGPDDQADATVGCGATTPPLSSVDASRVSAQTVDATVGQPFSVSLDSNPTTGYRWELAQPLDESILQLVQNAYQRSGPAMPGAGGSEIWTFEPLCQGATMIALRYRRPWEPPSANDRMAVYAVTVRDVASVGSGSN